MNNSTAASVRRRCGVRQLSPSSATLAAAFVVVTLALLAPKFANAADVIGGTLQSAGTLTLSLGADPDQFVWSNNPTGTDVVQLVKDKRDLTSSPKDACALALVPDATSPDALVKVEAISGNTAGTPGFNAQKNWIGVRQQSRGVDCGRVSPNQAVILSLTGQLAGYAVKHTKFQVNVKQNVVIKAHMTFKGGNAKNFYLYTGLSTAGAPAEGDYVDSNGVPYNVQYCEAGVSDSSPDSNANCSGSDLWEFDWVYDRAEFSTVGSDGEWSIAGPAISEFQIVKADGILDCGDTAASLGGAFPAQIIRRNNLGSYACVPIPYSLTTSCTDPDPNDPTVQRSCKVDFRYDPGATPIDQLAFVFHFEWPLYDVIPSGGIPTSISLSKQTFSNGFTTDLNFCPGTTATYDQDGVLLSLDGLTMADDQDGDPNNGLQAGCLTNRAVQQIGLGADLFEDGWLQGDWAVARN